MVERAFAGSWGDNALLALGDMALESGDYTAARWYWERIIPHPPPAGQLRHGRDIRTAISIWQPLRARLVLTSILEGYTDKAREELDQFTRCTAKPGAGWAGWR